MFWNGIELLEGEEWKDIGGFEGKFAISSYGRLASCVQGRWNLRKLTNAKNDYFRVVLLSKERKRTKYIHRLVAEAFVANPNGLKYVHHIDGNKQNNIASNLIWISGKEHQKLHTEENPNIISGMNYYNKHIRPKKIYQFNKDGEYIQYFENAKEASDLTGVCQRNILQVASKDEYRPGKRRYSAGGYIWSFDKEVDLRGWYDGCTL